MKEKIRVKDFVNEVKAKKVKNTQYNPHEVEDFIREQLNIKTYVPFAEKRELCKTVLDASCTRNGGIVEVDSVSRYILFTIAIISKYTNLEFSSGENDSINEYDILCQNDLLNPILGVIGNEYAVCNNILNMMMADIDANNNNVVMVLNKAIMGLLGILDDLKDVLADKIEQLNLDLSQIDIDEYKRVIDLFTQK